MRAILEALEATPAPEGVTAALEAHDRIEALIGSLAFILATSSSERSPAALRDYCREIGQRLRRKTEATQASLSGMANSKGRLN
ncbi:MAG: hypothetical protein JWO83_3511 [Caulobacteraceae bacterium]|nr:hypothetical protein [Caulobacteraceae bacterium]